VEDLRRWVRVLWLPAAKISCAVERAAPPPQQVSRMWRVGPFMVESGWYSQE